MMNNNKQEKVLCRKKVLVDEISLCDVKESVPSDKSKSMNAQINKQKEVTEMSSKLINKSKIIENLDDDKSRSFLKMPVTMNNFCENDKKDQKSVKDNSPSNCHTNYCSSNRTSKSEKIKNICRSCNTTNKVIKCKTSDTQLHVSIKSKKHICSNKNSLNIETNADNSLNNQENNCSLTLKEKPKVLRLDLLLQFLDQMRHKVITSELSFDTFKSISDRLVKDKMEIELLLLIEVVVRAQVVQMTKLISKDLCQNKLTPPLFVKSFLKQYKFLKSLSFTYKQILNDYEATYLAKNNLSIDLISRAYFKIIMCGCPKIKEYISSGHLYVKLDSVYDQTMTNTEKDQMKVNYSSLKSDFQDINKWKDVDKTIRNILDGPDDFVKSLVNYFNRHFAACFCRSSECKKECCNQRDLLLSQKPNGSYLELLRILPDLPERDICSISLTNPDSFEYLLKSHNNNFEIPISKYYKTSMKNTCRSMYQALENIKPPSISCSSSSNNSNGYNSCVSISSYEESSDDEEDDDKEERFFQKWKCNIEEITRNEETKPPTPVSFNDDENLESHEDVVYTRQIFRTKDRSCNQDDIEKFNQLYNQYLEENEHLLDNASLSSTSHMSVPDYLNTLEKADNLQSIIKTLMANYKKNIDLADLDHDHSYYSSSTCSNHNHKVFSDLEDTQIKEEDFGLEFEELTRKLGVGPSTRESLEEFEKFLESRHENKGKPHPNLEALVKTYRVYCNKLYKSGSKEVFHHKARESDSSETGKNIYSGDSKQTVSGDESFDIPYDCLPPVNIEIDTTHDNCSSNNNIHSTNNMSSSDTSSSSASTENTGNNKVCNCCKCEMFGEQNFPAVSRGTNVVEKLRLKLQKRKQCSQKVPTNKMTNSPQSNNNSNISSAEIAKLPDVDSLVEFINGPDKSDVTCQTPDMVRALSKKSKAKSNKTNVKMKSKKTPKSTEAIAVINGLEKSKRDVDKDLDLLSTVCLIREELSQNIREGYIQSNAEVTEEEVPDPVVEDFKRFCSNVVVPKNRKKLPLGATLLMDRSKFERNGVKEERSLAPHS